jgi:8-oxo-dGTP pyrophosphatase MutT (NUDIX family)
VTAPGTPSVNPSDPLTAQFSTLPDTPLPLDRADAAVLILLRGSYPDLEVLAEQRAERSGDPWSGQVGLPGGRTDRRDSSLTDTVLRELREEVGVLPTALAGPPRLFGIRQARPSGLRVAVFADRLTGESGGPTNVDPTEVTSAFWLPLRVLEQTESRPRPTMFGQVHVDTVSFEGYVVWGFTLRVLLDFSAWLDSPRGSVPPTPPRARPWRGRAV